MFDTAKFYRTSQFRKNFAYNYRVGIDLNTVAANLTSVSIVLFAVGFVAAQFSANVRLPDQVYDAITLFLLVSIGLKGGVALNEHWSNAIVLPVIVAIVLGTLIPIAAFGILGMMTRIDPLNRGSIAAHYGSTSLVTFTAALVYLDSRAIEYESYVSSLLVVLEIPGIIVGISLALRHRRATAAPSTLGRAVHEIFTGKTVFVLVGATLVGVISGSSGYAPVEPFFTTLRPGILALFLLHLGHVAGSQVTNLRKAGVGLFAFGVLFPITVGLAGAAVGTAIGLSIGGATVLATFLASASYIAAPAAVSIALPKANLSLAIAPSLAVTFPVNLTVGIPLYLLAATLLATVL